MERSVRRFCYDGDAALGQLVLNADDPVFIARNGPRGEHDGVAPVEFDERVLALGDARERGQSLALATRDQRRHLIARKRSEAVLIVIGKVLGPKTGIAGGLDNFVHGAADQHQFAASGAGSLGDCREPVHIRGEGGDRDAPLRAGDHGFQILANDLLRCALAIEQRVGAVADKHAHTLFAQAGELGFVGRIAKARRIVELPVARMEHIARGRAQENHVAFGDRVRDRHKVHVERTDVEAGALRHHDYGHFGAVGMLLKLPLEQMRGEFGRIDRHAQARPHLGHRADMIFVRVRDDNAGEALAFLLDEAQIG